MAYVIRERDKRATAAPLSTGWGRRATLARSRVRNLQMSKMYEVNGNYRKLTYPSYPFGKTPVSE